MVIKKERKTLVRWNAEDLAVVIPGAIEAWKSDQEQAWRWIAEGQKALPKERQRKVSGVASVSSDLMEAFCAARLEAITIEVPEPVVLDREIEIVPPRAELINSLTTDELMGLLAKRAAPLIDLLLPLAKKYLEKPVTVGVPPPQLSSLRDSVKEQTRSRKTRVLISGFLPGQEQDIEAQANDLKLNLELVFQRKDSTEEPPPSASWCVMFRKNSHAQYRKLKKGVGSDRLRIVEGTTDALKELADINSLVGQGIK
jgi:hypothetical protein